MLGACVGIGTGNHILIKKNHPGIQYGLTILSAQTKNNGVDWEFAL